MSRRGKKMAFTEKLTMIDQVKAGQTDDQIAQRSGWSKWTIRKWRRAYQARGERGLTPQMGRPQNGTLSSFPDAVRADLKSMRDEHPGWGPITLLEELIQRPDYWGKALPSRARVAAFLKEQGQVRPYQRHGGVRNPEPIPAIHPHERWEMDAQGRQKVDGLGQVILVNIMDVMSHLKVASYPALYRSGMHWQDYQLVLRQAFLEFGLPLQISLDHDSVTGMDWKSSSVLCTFDPVTLELVCRKAGTGLVKRFPIQRLSKADLMGELSYLKRLSAYQLALPFSMEDWRILATTQLSRGTTL